MKDDLLMKTQQNKLKKPLIYGAIGFLAFIVIVIAVALIQHPKKNSANEIVPNDNTPEEVMPASNIKTQSISGNETSNFQPIKVEEEPQVEPQINKQALIKNENTPYKNSSKEISSKKIGQNKISPKVNIKPQKKSVKEIFSPVSKKNKVVSKHKYYIQVAALLKYSKPNKKFLELITKSHFHYDFYVTYIKKGKEKIRVTKILIGPFNTKSEAKKALVEIKRKIAQNAFIFKVK